MEHKPRRSLPSPSRGECWTQRHGGGSVRQLQHSHPRPSSIFYMIPSGAGRRLLFLPSRTCSYLAAYSLTPRQATGGGTQHSALMRHAPRRPAEAKTRGFSVSSCFWLSFLLSLNLKSRHAVHHHTWSISKRINKSASQSSYCSVHRNGFSMWFQALDVCLSVAALRVVVGFTISPQALEGRSTTRTL